MRRALPIAALIGLGMLIFAIEIGIRIGIGIGATMQAGASPEELLAQAEAAFQQRFIQEKMEEAIAAYEALLPTLAALPVQSQAFVLDRLAQLYYELTTFSPGDTPEDKELFLKGKEYGLRSLRLNPQFKALERSNFAKAVSYITDPAALLWTADNWGAIFGYEPLQGMAGVGKVKALYERCLEVQEDYWGASCHNALGALLVTTPDFLGGDLQAGKEHLERAIALAPDYLENHVVYAQYWGFTYDFFGNVNGVRDRELIERELNFVLQAPIGKWPFWNREAKKEAQRLLKLLEKFSG